jgi:hypothetical protein
MKLKAKVTIYADAGVFAPGEVLILKDRKEAQSLIDRGFAEAPDEAVTSKPKDEEAR